MGKKGEVIMGFNAGITWNIVRIFNFLVIVFVFLFFLCGLFSLAEGNTDERVCSFQICNASGDKLSFYLFKKDADEKQFIQVLEVESESCALMIDENNFPPRLVLKPGKYFLEVHGPNGEYRSGDVNITKKMTDSCAQLNEDLGNVVRIYFEKFHE